MATTEFRITFKSLRTVLKKYENSLNVLKDKPEQYDVNAGYSEKWKREIYFGGAHIKKSYVSFYLMPVYMFPKLLDDLSDPLRARMQGKSCFNFKTIDPAQLEELSALTRKSFQRFRKEGLV